MKTTFINTGSTARLSADIDDLFNQLEKAACKACGSTVYPGVLSPDGYCADCLAYDLAAAPVPVVPTPSGSQRPQIENADKLHYRHQTVINSVFKIPFTPDEGAALPARSGVKIRAAPFWMPHLLVI